MTNKCFFDNEEKFTGISSIRLYRLTYTMYDVMTKPQDYGLDKPLNAGDLHSLQLIVENPGITASEIVGLLGRTKGTMSQTTSKLKSLGLIEQRKAPGNDKNLPLFATPAGEKITLVHQLRDRITVASANHYLLQHCSLDEYTAFLKVLDLYQDMIDHSETYAVTEPIFPDGK